MVTALTPAVMAPTAKSPFSDLDVVPISQALAGKKLDVVISGSIAATESVRFIRALRRLGADVTPWLSRGGMNFITPMSVAWASGKDPVTDFSGTTSHIATSDVVVVAPASSSLITKVARGMTDSHCTALIASALGQRKPVFFLPTMHDSLKDAPAFSENLLKIKSWPNVVILDGRHDEGKQKFPEPADLADQVAHHFHAPQCSTKPVLLTMGTTRGYLDDVRYISNYSSGRTGSAICEELYRWGLTTEVIAGPCEHKPRVFSRLTNVLTTGEMLSSCMQADAAGLSGAIFCASILDYEPTTRVAGKMRSGQDQLNFSLKPTPKIIAAVKAEGAPKIGFKLEADFDYSIADTRDNIAPIVKRYLDVYGLNALIVNGLTDIVAGHHDAVAFSQNRAPQHLSGKQAIAKWVTELVRSR